MCVNTVRVARSYVVPLLDIKGNCLSVSIVFSGIEAQALFPLASQ